jgi:hypothetical protein
VFSLVESWWFLGTPNPVSIYNIGVTSESTFRIGEDINEVFHTITSYLYLGTTSDWSCSWEEGLNKKSILTISVSLFKIFLFPFVLNFRFKITRTSNTATFDGITFSSTAIKIISSGTLKNYDRYIKWFLSKTSWSAGTGKGLRS